MPKHKIPEDIVNYMALPDRERRVEWIDLYLPSEFMRALERWAKRENTTPAVIASRVMSDAINMADMLAVAADPRSVDNTDRLPENVVRLRPKS